MTLVHHTALVLLAAGYGANYATAQTSLYIPILDPGPVTADIEGVDDTGHTTWRIGPGIPSGTLTDDSELFTSATLVADATSLHLVENDSSLDFAITIDCGVNNGQAVCTAVGSGNGMASMATTTQPASAFDVQFGGATSAPSGTNTIAPTGSQSSNASSGGASAPASDASSKAGSAPTGSNSGTSGASPIPTQGEKNGAVRFVSFALGYGMASLLVGFCLW
ncbi:hypothetical protein BN946_scf184999.g52 [Trametes cinnabarina]|uniref:Uncharacterized protein n=1 Tax=Pycnoporus cinnabarinus TaxID=5643 RepID=A0A060S857_PYCCI|nr:hypothetical protein BN946_scf184999.g52 [Trametes cinnabarina]